MSRSLAGALTLVLLAGCSSESPAPEPRRRAKARPTRTPPPPPPKVEPEPEPEPEPVAVREPSQWWCLCYEREGEAGPEPMTACRELESQCRKLESRIAKGSKTIIAGSLTHGCRPLTAEHPGDAAGGRDRWQPSRLAGAWASEGACQLITSAPELEPEPKPEAQPGDPFALMHGELIGELAIGSSTAEVRHRLGQPQTTGSIEESAATGAFEQPWTYADGLSLVMSSSTHSGPQTIAAMTIAAPSTLKTRRGIGIGSSRAEVERAYGDVQAPADEVDPDDPERFVAGSTYGGLVFSFHTGVVDEIFLGAGAE
jgi:hypothetical protein